MQMNDGSQLAELLAQITIFIKRLNQHRRQCPVTFAETVAGQFAMQVVAQTWSAAHPLTWIHPFIVVIVVARRWVITLVLRVAFVAIDSFSGYWLRGRLTRDCIGSVGLQVVRLVLRSCSTRVQLIVRLLLQKRVCR